MEGNQKPFNVYDLWNEIQEDKSMVNLCACYDRLLIEVAGRKMTEQEIIVHNYLRARVSFKV